MQPKLCGRCGAPVMAGASGCGFCGVAFEGVPAAPKPAGAGEAEIVDLLRKGEKITAIKLHRERFRTGLREAKDAVEALEKKYGIVIRS